MLMIIVKRQRQSGTKIPIFSSEFPADSGFPARTAKSLIRQSA
jgi:hypothetical protein